MPMPMQSVFTGSLRLLTVLARLVSALHIEIKMSRDEAKAKESLTALFAKVDKNGNGELDLPELQRVFGEHADQFLKFCDKDR